MLLSDDRLPSRRAVLTLLASGLGLAAAPRWLSAQTASTPVVVYKDPNCGCCQKWIEHLRANGFAVTVTDTTDMRPIKERYKVGPALASCHTGVLGAVVVEGHVPAADIRRFLAKPLPNVLGLTIPGMPQSAPGMDLRPFQPYTVLTFDARGNTTVFARHTTA
jgi:hypothetical protein